MKLKDFFYFHQLSTLTATIDDISLKAVETTHVNS